MGRLGDSEGTTDKQMAMGVHVINDTIMGHCAHIFIGSNDQMTIYGLPSRKIQYSPTQYGTGMTSHLL
jgi:hypothetical protein